MSDSAAENLIRKLALQGQTESDILTQLEKRDLRTPYTEEIVRKIIREYKAAQAFLPHRAPRNRIRLFGTLLLIIGGGIAVYFSQLPDTGLHRGNPTGLGGLLAIIGLILIFFPEKGTENL